MLDDYYLHTMQHDPAMYARMANVRPPYEGGYDPYIVSDPVSKILTKNNS
jgi:hypothetical protein